MRAVCKDANGFLLISGRNPGEEKEYIRKVEKVTADYPAHIYSGVR